MKINDPFTGQENLGKGIAAAATVRRQTGSNSNNGIKKKEDNLKEIFVKLHLWAAFFFALLRVRILHILHILWTS